jgi:hypothetical protein
MTNMSREYAVTEPWIDAEWIRDRLHATGKTQRALAHALELDPSAVSRLLDGARQLKAHEIPRVVDFFREPQTNDQATESGTQKETFNERLSTKEAFSDRPLEQPGRHRATPGPRPKTKPMAELPVLGPFVAEERGFYQLEGGVVERRPSPPQLVGVSGAYALFIPDDRLAPRYRAGEVIYIHPSKPPTVGSFVVVRFRSPKGTATIGEIALVESNSISLHVADINGQRALLRSPTGDLKLNLADIAQIGRILVTSTE